MGYGGKIPLPVGFEDSDKKYLKDLSVQWDISQAEVVRRLVCYMLGRSLLMYDALNNPVKGVEN